jgi:hypothetical protein
VNTLRTSTLLLLISDLPLPEEKTYPLKAMRISPDPEDLIIPLKEEAREVLIEKTRILPHSKFSQTQSPTSPLPKAKP